MESGVETALDPQLGFDVLTTTQNSEGQQEVRPPEHVPPLLPCCWTTAHPRPRFIMETTKQVIRAGMSYARHALVQRMQAVVFAPAPPTIFKAAKAQTRYAIVKGHLPLSSLCRMQAVECVYVSLPFTEGENHRKI